jgi:hydroxyethylthiazole kinase-like sugar kinase family protein
MFFVSSISNVSILLYDIASEIAARKEEVRGPGTFLPAFIDALNVLSGDFDPRIQNFGKISIWKPS